MRPSAVQPPVAVFGMPRPCTCSRLRPPPFESSRPTLFHWIGGGRPLLRPTLPTRLLFPFLGQFQRQLIRLRRLFSTAAFSAHCGSSRPIVHHGLVDVHSPHR